MLDELEPAELLWWQAFDRLEPLGLDRLEQQLALIGAQLCRVWGAKRIQPKHFLLGTREEQTVDQQKAVIRRQVAQQRASQRH